MVKSDDFIPLNVCNELWTQWCLYWWEEINYILNCIPERYIFPLSLAGLGQVGKETIMFFLSVPFINHHSGSKQFCSFFMSHGSQYRFLFFQLESVWKLSLMLGLNQLLFIDWASNHFTSTKMESWSILSVTLEFIYSFCYPKLSCWRPTEAAWVKWWDIRVTGHNFKCNPQCLGEDKIYFWLLLSKVCRRLQKKSAHTHTHTNRSSSEFLGFQCIFYTHPQTVDSFVSVTSDPHILLFNPGHFWFLSTRQLNVKQGANYHRIALGIVCLFA